MGLIHTIVQNPDTRTQLFWQISSERT